MILPNAAQRCVTLWLGKNVFYHPCRATSISFLFFQTLQKRSPLPTGPITLSSITGGTGRLFSLRHIWANQRLQQHLITAQALDVGEIMKHLIGETNIKVQKECSGREHREIASFCIQPPSTSPFQIGWGFLFCLFCFCWEFNMHDGWYISRGTYAPTIDAE